MRASLVVSLLCVLAVASGCTQSQMGPVATPSAVVGPRLAANQMLVPREVNPEDPFAGQVETILRTAWIGGATPVREFVGDASGIRASKGLPPIPPKPNYTLASGRTYEAELPKEVRDGSVLLSVSFSSPVADDPDQGPLLTIDGAEFGVAASPEATIRGPLWQIMVRTRENSGQAWQPLGLVTSRNPDSVAHLHFWLHFHSATRTFDVYQGHRLIRQGLVYEPDLAKGPTAVVRTMPRRQSSTMHAFSLITTPSDLSQVRGRSTEGGRGGRGGGDSAGSIIVP